METKQDIENREYYESMRVKGGYAALTGEVGFKKFMDLVSIFSPSSSEDRKQAVIDAMRERDQYYIENEDKLGAVDKFTGGLIETICNPAEIGAQVGLAVATGGSSIPVQLGAQAGFDIAQANIESYRYEDRFQTAGENIMTVATSVAPDLLMIGAGAAIRKAKSGIIKNQDIFGDININVLDEMRAYDNAGVGTKSKQQQIKTDFPEAVQEEVYKQGYKRIEKPSTQYFNHIKSFNPALQQVDFTSVSSIGHRAYMDTGANSTVLQRTMTDYNFIDKIDNMTPVELFGTPLDEIYGKGFSKKTSVQKAIIVQNKENDIVDNFTKSIEPTIEDYNRRMKASDGKEVGLFKEQIDNALLDINSSFQSQKLSVQNEYINIINKGYDDTPITLNDYIKSTGVDNKDISASWIKGTVSDSQHNKNGFLKTAYEDSIILDELDTKTSLFDISEFESFNRKFGKLFDEDGDIIFDGNIFENFSKATTDEKEIIVRAMKDNPTQFVEFITNAKETLDNVLQAGKNVSDEFKTKVSEIFNGDYNNIVKFLKKNKDYIVSEFSEFEKVLEKGQDAKIWKKGVATKIAERKRELAIESIKINQTVNKQELLKDMQKYFDIDRITSENFKNVTLKADMTEAFEKEIMPFYTNGTFKLLEGESPITHFASFIADLKKTRRSAKVIGEYKSIGELRTYFNENKMSDFFIDVNQGQYLKSNSELIRDIFDFNTSKTARFLEYGSTSPYVISNKFRYKLEESYAKLYGSELNEFQRKVLRTARERADRMFKSTQTGYAREIPNKTLIASQGLRQQLRRGILSFSGLPELLGQNYFITLSKAQRYGGSKVYLNQFRHITKNIKSDSKYAKYTIGNISKSIDISNIDANKFDLVAFSFQEASDKQMKKFGEIFSTQILDNLPMKMNMLENEMKDLLVRNGITDEASYNAFREFASNHIKGNNYYVNMNELTKAIQLDENQLAQTLRNVHYHLSDYIGNPAHKAPMNTVAMDEISNWYNLFRVFSKNMNADTLTRLTQYVDANGVAKNRFNITQWYGDMGGTGVAKDIALFGTASTMLILGGYGYSLSKELIESDRDFKQKVSLIRTKNDQIADIIQDKDFIEFVKLSVELTGTNPIDALTATNMPESLKNKFVKIYNTFTDEEKKTLGTNVEEGVAVLADEVIKTFGSRILRNVAVSAYKEVTQESIDTMPKKIYGFNKEDMDRFESYVRNPIFKEHNEMILDNEIKQKEAEINYMNNDVSSFEKLSDNLKGIAEVIISENNIQDKDDFRSDFAAKVSVGKSKEQIVYEIANERPSDNIDTQVTISALNSKNTEFDNFSQNKKNYFYLIMKYKKIDNPTKEDYDEFVNNFRNIKPYELNKVLKSKYGIDKNDFDEYYKYEDVRENAIESFKYKK